MPRFVRLDLAERAIESLAHAVRPESIRVEALGLGSRIETYHHRRQPFGEGERNLSRGPIIHRVPCGSSFASRRHALLPRSKSVRRDDAEG
jgi:hypothetical protein